MENTQDTVAATLRGIGICVSMRTILIRKGYFVGHKYRFDGGYAIRPAGKNVIEVFNDGGEQLKTVSLEETEKKGAA